MLDEMMPDETTGTAPPRFEYPRFRLGRLVATTGAMAAVAAAGLSPQSLLARHMGGDWGELCDEDRAENERALASGDRLLSCYRIKVGETMEAVWDHGGGPLGDDPAAPFGLLNPATDKASDWQSIRMHRDGLSRPRATGDAGLFRAGVVPHAGVLQARPPTRLPAQRPLPSLPRGATLAREECR